MRVLVMGGTGLLGAGIVRRLVAHGHEVTATSRGRKPVRELPESVRVATVDRHDLAAMRALIATVQPGAVVDGVAYAGQDGRDDLALFAGKVGHLVMISTDFAYKPSWQRLPIAEDAPLRAGTPYSEGKVDCEEVFRGQTDLPVTIFRPPHIMGPGGAFGTGSMQNRDRTLMSRLRQGVPVVLVDAGTYLIQPLHVDDGGDAIAAVLGREACFGRAYNLTSADAVTTREYYELVAREAGVALPMLSIPGDLWLRVRPDHVSYVRHRMYDLGALARDAGWRPRIGIDEAIARTARDIIRRGEDEPYVHAPAEAALVTALQKDGDNVVGALTAWEAARQAR